MEQRADRTSWPNRLGWLLAFVAIVATGVASFSLTKFGGRFSLPLLPSGIAVAACYRWGWRGFRGWPVVLAAGIAIELFKGSSLVFALGVGVGLAAASVLTVWLLERRKFDSSFSTAGDVPWFIFAAAVGMAVFPTCGFLASWLNGDPAEVRVPLVWTLWWGDTTSGVLLVGPLLVCLRRQSLQRFLHRPLDAALWIAGLAVCCAAIFFAPGDIGRPLIVVVANLVIIVAAIRFGLVVAATGALAISTCTAASFVFGVGVFGNFAMVQGLVTVWSFTAALVALTLVITALLAERDAEALERQRAQGRYEQLFEGSPQPVWVHDAATGAFLLVNAATLVQYGWNREQMLAGGIAMLATPAGPPALPDPGAEEPFETQHRVQSGRIIDVDVWCRAIDFDGRHAVLVFAADVTERRALAQALVDAIGSEQRRLGQEMHDGLGQELTGLALSARALATRAARDGLPIAADLADISQLANHCIRGSRAIVRGLAPLTDADGSLEAGLEALARRTSVAGAEVRFQGNIAAPLGVSLAARNHLYRIAQEAVQNALKHAAARSIDLELSVTATELRLLIRDDGRGAPPLAGARPGMGMRTMRFRARAIGGRLSIGSGPGGGTAVLCEAPNTPPAV